MYFYSEIRKYIQTNLPNRQFYIFLGHKVFLTGPWERLFWIKSQLHLENYVYHKTEFIISCVQLFPSITTASNTSTCVSST